MTACEVLSHNAECRIIIADHELPLKSGLDLLPILRRLKSKHEIRLMSSFMKDGGKIEATTLGAHALLEKPFQLTESLKTVAVLVAQNSLDIPS